MRITLYVHCTVTLRFKIILLGMPGPAHAVFFKGSCLILKQGAFL